MILFCLDTSTRAGSMALSREGAVTSIGGTDPRSHGQRLPVEAIDWLAVHGTALDGVDVFVVVAGPGSFTGLRVGVACVQGWAFALGRQVIAIPTLDAVAAACGRAIDADSVIVSCVDGQRGEVFFAARGADGEVVGPSVGKPAEMIAAVMPILAGRTSFVTGDGAGKYAAELEAAGWMTVPAMMPLAQAAVHLAAARLDAAGPPAAARPIYVRRTDAELTRDRAKHLR